MCWIRNPSELRSKSPAPRRSIAFAAAGLLFRATAINRGQTAWTHDAASQNGTSRSVHVFQSIPLIDARLARNALQDATGQFATARDRRQADRKKVVAPARPVAPNY
ncbi:MAG TPA: hypothetical protein VFY29_01750 [Terriglobia bacterium]|nr:hypothetical protein [Terriglobia bacterium]